MYAGELADIRQAVDQDTHNEHRYPWCAPLVRAKTVAELRPLGFTWAEEVNGERRQYKVMSHHCTILGDFVEEVCYKVL